MQARSLLLWIARHFKGNWAEMYNCVAKKIKPDLSNEDIEKAAEDYKIDFSSILDDDYPKIFKKYTDGTLPFVLFYDGDLNIINKTNKIISFTADEELNDTEYTILEKLIKHLPKTTVIATSSVDKANHQILELALKYEHKVIYVLDYGISSDSYFKNIVTFAEIVKTGGCIISEYPETVNEGPEDCSRWINRLIASVSQAIIYMNIFKKYTDHPLLSYGATLNKNIGAIPVAIDSEYDNNTLIKDGATMISSSKDIEELLC